MKSGTEMITVLVPHKHITMTTDVSCMLSYKKSICACYVMLSTKHPPISKWSLNCEFQQLASVQQFLKKLYGSAICMYDAITYSLRSGPRMSQHKKPESSSPKSG